tara:strand:+ start:823 stop:1323 length:501 start_codon:yes stop_codon:yes gene_type:complete
MSDLKVNSITGNTIAGVHIPGHVVQITYTEHAPYVTTTSSSFVDTGLQAAITPKFANSHILIVCSARAALSGCNGAETACRLLRNGVDVIGAEGQRYIYTRNESGSTNLHTSGYATFTRRDTSHNSTSTQTYKFQVKTNQGTIRHNDYSTGDPPAQSTIMLVELAQ